MATNSNKDDPGRGGGARPPATLDLKAKTTSVSAPEGEAAPAGAAEDPAKETDRPKETGPKSAAPAKDGKDAREPGAGKEVRAAAPARSGSGAALFLTHLMAGLTGGFVAIVAAYYGVDHFRESLPFETNTEAAKLRFHVGALDRRLGALETSRTPQPESAGAPPQPAGVDPAVVETLTAAGAQAGQTAARAERSATQAEQAATQAASEVKTLEQSLAALEGRLERAEAGLAAAASASPQAPASAPAPAAPAAAAPEMEGRLRAEIAPVKTRVDALAKTVDGLTRSLQGLNKWRTEQHSAQQVAAVSSAFAALRRAFDSGKPYEAELKAITDSAPVSLDLSALVARQNDGAPTYAMLVERFNAASRSALAAAGRTKSGGIVGEALSRVQSAVRVRPEGTPGGDEPAAVIARMEAMVKAGDIAGAVREGQTLKEPAAASFKAWLKDAGIKAAGQEALNRAEAKLAGAPGDAERSGSGRRGG